VPKIPQRDLKPYWTTRDGESVKLYLGDALKLLPQFPAKSVDFVFTDPPYGHNNNDGDLIHNWEKATGRFSKGDDGTMVYEERPILNDAPEEANPLFRDVLPLLYRLLMNGSCCCCCGGGPDPQFARWSLWMDEVFRFKQMVVFDKGPMGLGWHYRRSYETILVGEVPGAPCRWYDRTCKIENIIRPSLAKGRGIRKIIPGKNHHPTQKPMELAQFFIGLHSLPGHLVLDPFAGSCSTGVAAVLGGRKFTGIELDEEVLKAGIENLRGNLLERPQFASLVQPSVKRLQLGRKLTSA
jgi:DNA modification methylase